mgnify:CR=1 FL=1
MKIKRNVEEKKKFCALCPGTVFLAGSIPHMKTDTVTIGYDEDVFNAVALETGAFGWFDDEDLVRPCYDAELLIP